MNGAARIGIPVLVGFLSATGTAWSQPIDTPTAEMATEHLTGGGERAWVAERWIQVLAEEAKQCESGQVWIFRHDGSGTTRTCDNGSARERNFSWAWLESEGNKRVLKVQDKQYIAVLRQKPAEVEGAPPVLVTILRELRNSQAEPVWKITLKFQNL